MDYRIPEKRYFRIGEVSALTQLEPHVIRYWEKEFPSLRPLRADSRQRLYSRDDVRLIMDIRRLLHEERYTIAGARRRLMGQEPEGPNLEAETTMEAMPPAASEAAPARPSPLAPPSRLNGLQPDLPLFPEARADSAGEVGEENHTQLLVEIKQELGRIIRVLS